MKFGTFFEIEVPRPWTEGKEKRRFHEALEQVELADALGYDFAWAVEHHFLEEYSHCSAPAVFLAAASQRTEDVRLGHGIRLTPPEYNHPARVAEMAATLDIVSDGRLELGTGSSGTPQELRGFGIDHTEKHDMWRETTEQISDMMSLSPYPGFDGDYFSMPPRDVLPKPVQDPHPPMWVACTQPESIEFAAKHGLGALTFIFSDPEEADEWVDLYYETLKEECVPIARSVNPNVAMVTNFSCHYDEETAYERAAEGFEFFNYSIKWLARSGVHVPGNKDIWSAFEEEGKETDFEAIHNAIGTPEQIHGHLEGFAEAGADQVMFLQQAGNNEHQHICESMEIFAEEVMPTFHEGEAERVRTKAEELEPYIEEAMERREFRDAPGADELDPIEPFGQDDDE